MKEHQLPIDDTSALQGRVQKWRLPEELKNHIFLYLSMDGVSDLTVTLSSLPLNSIVLGHDRGAAFLSASSMSKRGSQVYSIYQISCKNCSAPMSLICQPNLSLSPRFIGTRLFLLGQSYSPST